jgi:hypothetical protein
MRKRKYNEPPKCEYCFWTLTHIKHDYCDFHERSTEPDSKCNQFIRAEWHKKKVKDGN